MKRFTRKILILINLTAALGLCFAYLCNIVDPAKMALFAFFGLAYPYLLFINLGFFMFWGWRGKRLALISLFCILLGFGNIGRYFQIRLSNQSENKKDLLKTITYNVRVFNHFEWEKGASVRDSILDFLRNESADIICMQEFLTRTDRPRQSEKYIGQKLSDTPYSHVNYTIKSNRGATQFGLATYTRFPIVRKGVIIFENSPNACIYSDIAREEDTLRVYNIHLQSIKLKKDDYGVLDSLFSINAKRLSELKALSATLKEAFIKRSEQVNSIVRHMNGSPYPVILCGDFNDTPVSYSYHQLLGEKKDAFREAGVGMSQTYRGKLPSYRIDYVMYSENISAKTYATRRINYSDHYPVITHLKVD